MNAIISSQQLLDALDARVENHLKAAIDIFQNLEENLLMRKSPSGGWSIAECLWHLNSYGDFYLPEIEKALKRNQKRSNTFKSGWLGGYFTQLMKPGAKMNKMKAFKSHTPPIITEPYKVVALFIEQQERLINLLKAAQASDLTNTKVPISISPFIRLRLGDVFQFVIEHNERHLVQARNNLK